VSANAELLYRYGFPHTDSNCAVLFRRALEYVSNGAVFCHLKSLLDKQGGGTCHFLLFSGIVIGMIVEANIVCLITGAGRP